MIEQPFMPRGDGSVDAKLSVEETEALLRVAADILNDARPDFPVLNTEIALVASSRFLAINLPRVFSTYLASATGSSSYVV